MNNELIDRIDNALRELPYSASSVPGLDTLLSEAVEALRPKSGGENAMNKPLSQQMWDWNLLDGEVRPDEWKVQEWSRQVAKMEFELDALRQQSEPTGDVAELVRDARESAADCLEDEGSEELGKMIESMADMLTRLDRECNQLAADKAYLRMEANSTMTALVETMGEDVAADMVKREQRIAELERQRDAYDRELVAIIGNLKAAAYKEYATAIKDHLREIRDMGAK